jgi:lipopolysaccharide export LptBFGC system permease protein LptF
MPRIFFILLLVLLGSTSCLPVLIHKSIKEEKQRNVDAVSILSAKSLTHSFVEGSQRQESLLRTTSNEELIFIHERTIFQHGDLYSVSRIDDNSRCITYFEIVFLAQNKRIEVERFSVWAVIQLLDQNQVFEVAALNDEAVDRIVVKYGNNSFSSLVNNRPNVIIRDRGGNR